MARRIKVDSVTNFKLVHRYLGFSTTTKYAHRLSYRRAGKKYQRYQKIEYIKKTYHIQWKNIWGDIKHIFTTEWGVRYAYGVLALVLFIKTKNPIFLFAQGALTLDSATESNNTTTFNVTVASNSDRMMIMGFGHYQGGNNISGATYNSDALTEVKAQAGSYGERAGLWGLVAPDTGTNSFVISGNDSWSGYGVISVYNVDQTLPDTTGGASGNSNTASASLTTTVDNAWVVAAFGCESIPTMTTSDGAEDMKEQGASYQNAEMHHVAKASAGSQSMSCSLSYGARWNVALCQLKPAVASSTAYVNSFYGPSGYF